MYWEDVSQMWGMATVDPVAPGEGIREGFKKSKWKFKGAFAMKGGGGLEGVSSAIYLFWKMIFLKTI